MNHDKGYPCPCCGYLTVSEPPGSYEICSVCNWEDDFVQFNDINYEGGANEESLREGRENFKKYGASALRFLKDVRSPLPEELP